MFCSQTLGELLARDHHSVEGSEESEDAWVQSTPGYCEQGTPG